ncbi:MAG: hypothetical protein JNM93_00705 [Bacteriovoracaceae bacterium]|nr:hypothetical protein [Bacteriovoracaceae bacterium]
MRKLFLKHLGFSLVEVMLAVGVGSIVTLSVMSLMQNAARQKASMERDSDVGVAITYLENALANNDVFEDNFVTPGITCTNYRDDSVCDNLPLVINGAGIAVGGQQVFQAGTRFGRITVGQIRILEIRPLTDTVSANAGTTLPGIIEIEANFNKNDIVGGKKVTYGSGTAQATIKLTTRLTENAAGDLTITDLMYSQNSRTVALQDNCDQLTGAAGNWNFDPTYQNMQLIPYTDTNGGSQDILISGTNIGTQGELSTFGRCNHNYFEETCEDFSRGYDVAVGVDTVYTDNEAVAWHNRCQNANEVVCLALGRQWSEDIENPGVFRCYDQCLCENVLCGPNSANLKNCGQCCAPMTCVLGDANDMANDSTANGICTCGADTTAPIACQTP